MLAEDGDDDKVVIFTTRDNLRRLSEAYSMDCERGVAEFGILSLGPNFLLP